MKYLTRTIAPAMFSALLLVGCGGDTPEKTSTDSAAVVSGGTATTGTASAGSGAAPSTTSDTAVGAGNVTVSVGDTARRTAAGVQAQPLAPDPTASVPRPAALQSVAASGTITYKGKVGTEDMSTTLYFTDRGATRASWNTYHTTVEGKQYTVENVSVTRDGTSTLWDPKKRVGTRSPIVPGSYTPDFARLTAEQRTAYAYRSLPPKTILGHSCQGHSVVINGMRTSIWVWEGLPMRSETGDESSVALSMEAVALDLTAPVPEEKFAIPADVKISAVGGATTGSK